jgi:hypothetical protein
MTELPPALYRVSVWLTSPSTSELSEVSRMKRAALTRASLLGLLANRLRLPTCTVSDVTEARMLVKSSIASTMLDFTSNLLTQI